MAEGGGGGVKFTETCTIHAGRLAVWDFFLDAPSVARCMEGVETFDAVGDDQFRGALRVKLGPVALRFEGTLQVELRDRAQSRILLRADARDRKRGGRLRAHLDLQLAEEHAGKTRLEVGLDAQLQGKISEFGQPLIRRKTQRMLRDFAERVSSQLGAERLFEGR